MTPAEAAQSEYPYFRLFARFKEKGFHRLPNYRHLALLDRKREHELNFAGGVYLANRCAPELFDDQGQLLPRWREPLPARWKAKTPDQLQGFSPGARHVVDNDVRQAIEELDPDRHVFIDLAIFNRIESSRDFSVLIICNSTTQHILDGPDPPQGIGEPVQVATVDRAGLNGYHLTTDISIIISRELLRKIAGSFGSAIEFQPLVFAE